jgi:hypothetical protein
MKFSSAIAMAASLMAGVAMAEDAKPAPKKTGYFQERVTEWMVGPTEEQRMQDPLRFLANDMGGVAKDLGALKTGQPVQKDEKQVVARLDQLIAMLQKQCSGSGSGMSRNPTKPLASSRIMRGPGGQGELINARENGKEWGSLPPQLREQILQSHTEGFPPGYETILQSYYQRLAQEKVPDAGADRPTGPTTRPGKQ